MFKKVFIILFLSLGFISKAQIWTPLDTGLQSYIPYGLLADETNGNLYAFGNVGFNNGLSVWKNNHWEVWYRNINWGTYGSEVAILNNKTVFFHRYYENNNNSKPRTAILSFSDSTNLDTLKVLQNQNWIPVGNSKYCIYQGKLILFNAVSNVNGINAIATFDGDTIIPIGDPTIDGFSSACVFNGELYATGSNLSAQRGVFKKTPAGWQLIYQIQGGLAFLQGMIVYNNRLFIFGGMSAQIDPTNIGEGIIAYDGVNFDPIGGGVVNDFDVSNGYVLDAAISGNRLYVTGEFLKAGGTNSRCLAYWNDTTWCSIYKDLDSTYNFFKIESFKDTIYEVADFREVNGDTTFGWIAKLYDKNYSDTCSAPYFVSVEEINQSNNIKIYPNPTTSIINIVDENNQLQNSTIQIQNYLGQLVFSSPFNSQIDLRSLSAGMYFLTINDKLNNKTVKIIKQ